METIFLEALSAHVTLHCKSFPGILVQQVVDDLLTLEEVVELYQTIAIVLNRTQLTDLSLEFGNVLWVNIGRHDLCPLRLSFFLPDLISILSKDALVLRLVLLGLL